MKNKLYSGVWNKCNNRKPLSSTSHGCCVLISKICDNLWHLWENLFSVFIRDIVGIRVRYPMVRRSLPQIARIYTDVGAKGKKIAHLTVPFLTVRRFCRHNICIPDAQYYEFSAQQNLWCEILEFWALGDNAFIHSELYDFRTKRYEIRPANELLLYAIAPLLHSNSATFIMQ